MTNYRPSYLFKRGGYPKVHGWSQEKRYRRVKSPNGTFLRFRDTKRKRKKSLPLVRSQVEGGKKEER